MQPPDHQGERVTEHLPAGEAAPAAAAPAPSRAHPHLGGSGPVAPTPTNASAMIAAADIVGEDGNIELEFDYANPPTGAYPIVLVTYELVCASGLPESFNPALVASFLTYAASDAGQAALEAGGYAPITGDLLASVREVIAGMTS